MAQFAQRTQAPGAAVEQIGRFQGIASQHADRVPGVEQLIDQGFADKPGPPRHQHTLIGTAREWVGRFALTLHA